MASIITTDIDTTGLSERAQHLAKQYKGYSSTELNAVQLKTIELFENARNKGHKHAAAYIRGDVIALRELIDSITVVRTG